MKSALYAVLPLLILGCTRLSNQVQHSTVECGEDFIASDAEWFQSESASGKVLSGSEIEVLNIPETGHELNKIPVSSRGCFHLPADSSTWIVRSIDNKTSKLITSRAREKGLSHRIVLEDHGPDDMTLACPKTPLSPGRISADQFFKTDDLNGGRRLLHITLMQGPSIVPLQDSSAYLQQHSQSLVPTILPDGPYHLQAQIHDLRRGHSRNHECDIMVDGTAPGVDVDRTYLFPDKAGSIDIHVISRQDQLRFVPQAIDAHDDVKIEYCFQALAESEMGSAPAQKIICAQDAIKSVRLGEPISPQVNSGAWLLQFTAVDAAGNRSQPIVTGPIVFVDSAAIRGIQLEGRTDIVQTELSREKGVFDILGKAFRNYAIWKNLTTAVERELARDAILSLFYAAHIGMNHHSRFATVSGRSAKAVMTKDGRHIIAGLYGGGIQVVDTRSGKIVKTMRNHSVTASELALSLDEKTLVAGAFNQEITVWDLESGKVQATVPCCQGEFPRLSISPDKSRIFASSWSGVLNIWSSTGTLIKSISLDSEPNFHRDVIMSLKVSADGRYLVTASWDRSIRLWDHDGNFIRKMVTDHEDGVNAIDISPDSKYLVSVGKDGQVLMHNLADGSLLKRLAVLPTSATAVAIGGGKILVGSLDRAVRLWSERTGELLEGPLKLEYFGMDSVTINATGDLFAATTDSPIIRIWGSGGASDFLETLAGHEAGSSIRSLALDRESQRLYSAGSDRQTIAWNLNSREKAWSARDAEDTVYALKISPTQDHLYSASKDGRLRRYPLAGPTERGEVVFEHPDDWLFSLDFDPVQSRVFLGTWNGLMLAPQEQGTLKRRISREGWSKVIFHPGRRQLLALNRDSHLGLLDPDTLVESKSLRFGEGLIAGTLSADGQRLFTGDWNGRISAVDMPSFTTDYSFDGEGGIVWDLVHDASSDFLLSVSNDGKLRIWNSRTRGLLGVPLQVSRKAVRSLLYNSDRRTVITGDDDGQVKIWHLPLTRNIEEMKALLCAEAGEVLRAAWFSDRSGHPVGELCD